MCTPGVLFNVDTWTTRDMIGPMYDSQRFVSYTNILVQFISLQLLFHLYVYFRKPKP